MNKASSDEVAEKLLAILRSRASLAGRLRRTAVPLAEMRDQLDLPLVRDASHAFDRLYGDGRLRYEGGWLIVALAT